MMLKISPGPGFPNRIDFGTRKQIEICKDPRIQTTFDRKTKPEIENHGPQSGLGSTIEFEMSRYKANCPMPAE